MKRLIGVLSILAVVCLPIAAQTQQTIRVNAGGPAYRDTKGQLWSADYGYNTGELSSSARSATVTGTSDPTLFKSARFSPSSEPELQYQFAVENGIYKVNLYFAETNFRSAGRRVFDVRMQGATLFRALDIFAQAGADHALVKSAQISVTDGRVVIQFVRHANANFPIISALEILPWETATAPSITKQPANQSITAGQTAQFQVVAAGTAPLSYQWQKNVAPILGATSSTYTTPVTTSADNGETFRVVISNSDGSVTSNSAALSVASGPVITKQPANQTVAVGQTATFSVVANGTAPLSYQWLKNGANISGATADSYTTSAVASSDNGSTFQVAINNSAGHLTSAVATLTVSSPLAINTSSLPSGATGKAYSATLGASGGTTPYSWSVSSGALPAGLKLSAAGTISGTPTASSSSSFTVKVTDSTTPTAQTASKSFTISVAAAVTPVTITTSTLAAGQVGVAYSTLLAASGGTTPYSWSLGSGILPAGLSLSTGGTLSGTPTTAGSFTFTIKVTDSTTPTAQTATKSLTFTAAAANGPVQITTTSVPAGQVSVAYSTTLQAREGTTPYIWSISSGSLPAGLTLSAGGTISGTPTATGSSSFTVKVTDSGSPTTSATASFSVIIAAGSGYSVLLKWAASPSSGVTGYNVYRSQVSGSGFAKINSSLVAGLTYTDATVTTGQTYYYVTTSVNSSGNESAYSEQIEMDIP